jgi:translation initiation factor 4G
MMEVYFQRIQTIVELPDLPSRLKFMLMDVVDLRKAHWNSKETNKGPKTLDEIRAEVCTAEERQVGGASSKC